MGSLLPVSEQIQHTSLYCRAEIFNLFWNLPDTEPDLIDPTKVGNVISSLPQWKAAGPDHLCNEHLLFADSKVLESLF